MDHTPTRDRERAFHDQWAQETPVERVAVHATFEHPTSPENQYILSKMGPLAGKRILDVGCGLGESSVYFALKGARVTATDISPEMCALCDRTASHYGVSVETAATSLEELDVPAKSFDIVYAANVLHHVTDTKAALRSAARALKPQGQAFFVDPLAHNPVINVYRRMATDVRTRDEHPLTFSVLDEFRETFRRVEHREFWLLSLALFLKYFLVDGLNPNNVRYWKHMLWEDPDRIRPWLSPLQRMDRHLLRLPMVKRLAWNIVICAER